MIEEVNESTNEVEKSSSLGKASTDGTSLAVDESSEGSMVDVTPMETKSDSESSNDDAEVDEDSANEQNLSGIEIAIYFFKFYLFIIHIDYSLRPNIFQRSNGYINLDLIHKRFSSDDADNNQDEISSRSSYQHYIS